MLAQYRSKTFSFVIAGIVLQILGGTFAKAGFLGWLVGGPIGLLGSVLLIMGCCFFAKAKGYAWWVGLLGLLSCLGLVVLYLLPERQAWSAGSSRADATGAVGQQVQNDQTEAAEQAEQADPPGIALGLGEEAAAHD